MLRDQDIVPLSIALLFSGLLHGALIAFLPGISLLPRHDEERPIVVELFRPRLSPPPFKEAVEEKLIPKPKEPTSSSVTDAAPKVKVPAPPSLEPLYGALERLSVLQNQAAPPVDIMLPLQEQKSRSKEVPVQEQPLAFAQSLLNKIEQGKLPSGNPERKELPLGFGRITALDKPDLPGRFSLDQPPFSALPTPPPLESRLIVPANIQLGIRGPVSERRVVFQPPLPEVRLTAETEIELKFWVLPDGTVGRVIPLRKGDTQLEAIAISYLKQWRFEPLTTPGTPEEQWGTIPFKFLVR
jgi:TonB family protein